MASHTAAGGHVVARGIPGESAIIPTRTSVLLWFYAAEGSRPRRWWRRSERPLMRARSRGSRRVGEAARRFASGRRRAVSSRFRLIDSESFRRRRGDGSPGRLRFLDDFLRLVRAFPDVWIVTCAEIAASVP